MKPPYRRVAVLVVSLATSAPAVRAQTSPAWHSELVATERSPGMLAGTLVVPNVPGPVPLVVIIAGSGPTDRDGNTGNPAKGANELRQLAESLATHGVASVRYDKRGQYGSASVAIAEADLRFEMLAADVGAWIAKFRGDSRFRRIIVLGHSEGALLGLLAMKSQPADAYISIAGPARRADAVLRDQLAVGLPEPLRATADTILRALRDGRRTEQVPAPLAALFRPSVQPYLISWFKYAAEEEIRGLSIPCLVVQGTSDIQVAPAEAERLQRANPSCQVKVVEGMNHVLKHTPADRAAQMPAYFDPSLPLAPGLVGALVGFIAKSGAGH